MSLDSQQSQAAEGAQQVTEKKLFLHQKLEQKDNLDSTLQGLRIRIGELERNISITERGITDENLILQDNEGKVARNLKRIGEIDTTVGENQKTIEKNGSRHKILGDEIAELVKQKESPEKLEATGSVTETKTSKEIDDQIAARRTVQAQIESETQELQKKNAKLAQERVAQESEKKIHEDAVEANKAEIGRLTAIKNEQLLERDNRATERDNDEREMRVLLDGIDQDTHDIEKIADEISRSHAFSEKNSEISEKSNLVTSMMRDLSDFAFVGLA